MARIVVQKYGGSSVSDVQGIQRVAKRIVETVRAGWQVVVVVSAMGNTTNELLSLAKSVSSSPKRRELDLLVSVGERISMTLLAMAVEDMGVKAKSFTGSQSGIITDENHIAATILEVRPFRIEKALSEGFVSIVAGFQGMSRKKEVTTLGRGGSDTTAVALAAALRAEFCEICSDVDGVYTADPRIVRDAKKLKEMSLNDAWVLSKHGAKVLQAAALEYALDQKIELCANATDQTIGKGTLLTLKDKQKNAAVTADTSLFWVCCEGEIPPWMDSISVYSWPSTEGIHILLDKKNMHQAIELPSGVRALGDVDTVSVAGAPDNLQFLTILKDIHLHYWWKTASVWSVVVDKECTQKAVQILHDALCS